MFTGTTRREIAAEGKEDGERNIPEMGSYMPAHFEVALIARGEREVQRRYEKASIRIAKLQPLFYAYKKRLEDIAARFAVLVEGHDARKKELGRDLTASFPYMYHIYLILFLGIAEFPLNTIVFRLFGEAEYLTYIMASSLAITIPLLGLFIGVHLRQSIPSTPGKIVIGLMIPISVGAALIAVSMLRGTYVSSQAAVATSAPNEGNSLAYALFALNMLVFSAAVVSSYFAHDSDEKLDTGRKALIFLDRKRNAIRKRLLRLGTRLNGEIKKAKSGVEQVRATTSEQVALYRQANMRARSLLPPPTFRKELEFPSLEWWPEVALKN